MVQICSYIKCNCIYIRTRETPEFHHDKAYSLAWPELFLAMGVIACSISAQPKKGLVNCLYTSCSTATIVAAPIKSQHSS